MNLKVRKAEFFKQSGFKTGQKFPTGIFVYFNRTCSPQLISLLFHNGMLECISK